MVIRMAALLLAVLAGEGARFLSDLVPPMMGD